jgi:hypothetical protein
MKRVAQFPGARLLFQLAPVVFVLGVFIFLSGILGVLYNVPPFTDGFAAALESHKGETNLTLYAILCALSFTAAFASVFLGRKNKPKGIVAALASGIAIASIAIPTVPQTHWSINIIYGFSVVLGATLGSYLAVAVPDLRAAMSAHRIETVQEAARAQQLATQVT